MCCTIRYFDDVKQVIIVSNNFISIIIFRILLHAQYKVLLCFAIGAEVLIVCYFLLSINNINEQIQNQLKKWTDEYRQENVTSVEKLDNVQTYVRRFYLFTYFLKQVIFIFASPFFDCCH